MNIHAISGMMVLASLAIASAPVHTLSHPRTVGLAATKQDATYSTDLNRAKNLARQAAEHENGGVIVVCFRAVYAWPCFRITLRRQW